MQWRSQELFVGGGQAKCNKILKVFFLYNLNGRPQTSNLCHKNLKNKSFINYKRVIHVFFFLLIILILKMGKEKFEFQMQWTHKKMLTK